MQTTQLRHCLHILCPKIGLTALFFVFLSSSPQLKAQIKPGGDLNLQYYDSHFLHYGILLALHSTRYSVLYSTEYISDEFSELHSIHSVNSPGFKLGFVINARIMDRLDFRILPTVGFYENKLEYYMLDGRIQEQLRDYTLLEIPLLFKYKSIRRGNRRLYLLAGYTPAFEASQKEDVVKENNLLTTTKRFNSLELGVGLDMYSPFFKFSPEVRYSWALGNVLDDGDSFFHKPLKSLSPRTVTIYFTFEGGAY